MSLVARLYVLVALAVLPAIVIQGLNELSLRRDREAEVHEEALADLKHRMDTMIRQIQETLSKLHDAQKLVLANITRA